MAKRSVHDPVPKMHETFSPINNKVMEFVDLIDKTVIVTYRSHRYQGQLLHIDPKTEMILLQAENLMIFNRIGYESIQICYEQNTQEISFYDSIRLVENQEEHKQLILKNLQDHEYTLQGDTIVVDNSCWIDPPYNTIVCPDPKKFQFYTELLQCVLF
jgi:small nuclear ribonucleoprotein (snRNP)-like protein